MFISLGFDPGSIRMCLTGSNKYLRADLTWSSKKPQLQERKMREMGRKNVL